MTNERQPEALRLAKILEDNYFDADTNEAAAELRRQRAENADFRATIDHLTRENAEQIGEIVELKELRDELLEALKKLMREWNTPSEYLEAARNARSAIAKAEGEKS